MAGARKDSGTLPFAAEKVIEITNAVRALCVIYNTGLTYQTSHQVFRRAVDERVPDFHAALKGTQGIHLFFTDGHIRAGAVAIEPGSSMLQKLAVQFEGMGVAGISILPGISSDDIARFMNLIALRADDVRAHGLQNLLSREGVKAIVENKVSAQIKDAATLTTRKPGSDAAESRRSRPAAKSAVATGGGAWDLDVEIRTEVSALRQDSDIYAAKPFGDFVQGTLSALARNEILSEEVAKIVSAEFARRLTEKVEDIRKGHERKVRRLETVQDLVLRELEALHLAAIIVDWDLRVLAANRHGREIIGEENRLSPGSPIERFIASGEERQEIEICGKRRIAHLLTSATRHGIDTVMLISLE